MNHTIEISLLEEVYDASAKFVRCQKALAAAEADYRKKVNAYYKATA